MTAGIAFSAVAAVSATTSTAAAANGVVSSAAASGTFANRAWRLASTSKIWTNIQTFITPAK